MQLSADPLDRIALRLPVRAESVGIGRRAAARFAEEHGLDELAVGRVRLSVSEALANVVLHAHAPGEERGQHLQLLVQADVAGCRVTVADDGDGLRARTDSPGMGLGLGLIATSCDDLALDTGRDGGTVVRMTFLR